jgi:hypothetical protein
MVRTFFAVTVCAFLALIGTVTLPPRLASASNVHTGSYTMLISITTSDGGGVSSQTIGGYTSFQTCALATQELIRQKRSSKDRVGYFMYCVPTDNPSHVD